MFPGFPASFTHYAYFAIWVSFCAFSATFDIFLSMLPSEVWCLESLKKCDHSKILGKQLVNNI